MNKQQLASRIWESANKMRSKIEANEYKDYILGFIFYKFLSEKEEKYLRDNSYTEKDIHNLTEKNAEDVEDIQNGIGYFISYDNLFSTWLKLGKDFSIENVTLALGAFKRRISPSHKKVFEGIFDTLDSGLTKLGDDDNSRTKAIYDLIDLIKDVPMDDKQDYDVLGFIYEYLISNFAANAGKKAGEFYTPYEASFLMAEIVANHVKNKKEIKIYDPTSGSGSLLINIGKAVAKHIEDGNKIKYYAQELKENTYNLTRMNLVMRGILPDNIIARNGDTLADDWPFFEEGHPETYEPVWVDAVVSNPPYSQKWEPSSPDIRFDDYGIAPKSKADYAFLLHDLYHLENDGIMTIVLPHGVLFRGGEEGEIRKRLIEKDNIETIIGLPANMFFGTGIPTIIMVLKKERNENDILIVDASKGFIKDGKKNRLQAKDIRKIVDTVLNRKTIDKYSRLVSKEEVRRNDYNLNIPRYVDSSDSGEKWDIYSIMFGGVPNSEIDELSNYWKTFPSLRKEIFETKDIPYSNINNVDIKGIIESNKDVKKYLENYKEKFSNFNKFLKIELIEKLDKINSFKEEDVLADYIKENGDWGLIDYYDAYQILDDIWKIISVDLEMIKTEGKEAIRQVDPNMVKKTKNKKETEVQEGWIGHILPFDLIQETLLINEKKELIDNEIKLADFENKYEELLEKFTEDEKESENQLFTDEDDAFVNAEIEKRAKVIRKEIKKNTSLYDKDSIETKIIEVSDTIADEKELKKIVKKLADDLHRKTKETIEKLSEEKMYELLEAKWITPLCNGINELPEKVINELVSAINIMVKKYEITYAETAQEISTTEDELSKLIDELEGNEFDMKGLSELKSLIGKK